MSLKENVLVIGEGGAGAEIVKTLIEVQSDINCACVVASESERFKLRSIENKLIGVVQLDIDGTGKKTKYGYKGAKKKEEELKKLIGDYPIIFHICGYGGGTGSGTALAIAQMTPNRRHLFIGPLPDFSEGRQIVKNTLNNLQMMFNFGRFWPIDNKLNQDSLGYDEFNKKIAYEIDYVLSLPDIKTYYKRDMDTGNVLDILFPENYSRQGLFSLKKFVIDDLNKPISFKNIKDRDSSVSYKFDFMAFEKVGVVIQLSEQQEINEQVNNNIILLKEWLFNEIPGLSIHESIYKSSSDKNEIVLLLSGPIFNSKLLEEYVIEVKNMEEKIKENLTSIDAVFNIDLGEEIVFNNKNNKANNLFGEEILFEDDEDDLFDFLG